MRPASHRAGEQRQRPVHPECRPPPCRGRRGATRPLPLSGGQSWPPAPAGGPGCVRSRWEGADPLLSLEGPGTPATHGQVSAGEAELGGWVARGQAGLGCCQEGSRAPWPQDHRPHTCWSPAQGSRGCPVRGASWWAVTPGPWACEYTDSLQRQPSPPPTPPTDRPPSGASWNSPIWHPRRA